MGKGFAGYEQGNVVAAALDVVFIVEGLDKEKDLLTGTVLRRGRCGVAEGNKTNWSAASCAYLAPDVDTWRRMGSPGGPHGRDAAIVDAFYERPRRRSDYVRIEGGATLFRLERIALKDRCLKGGQRDPMSWWETMGEGARIALKDHYARSVVALMTVGNRVYTLDAEELRTLAALFAVTAEE